ncbi:helix-turn-helix domain-containing protein [Paraburkholderia sediminicola]|uniref:helix-turn-helix domain-containing protein n=1 Tax=Paraburkholderia sediminicola TaxID=458836 RepID=UPI002847AE36|nr:helix-turn-helix domain-containing protein [Candidatus Paceibacterota bacterium]
MGRRPAVLDDKTIAEIRALLRNPDVPISSITKRYGISKTTLYRSVKRAEKKEAEGTPTGRNAKPRSNTR